MALFGMGQKKKIDELKQQLDEQRFEQAAMVADEIPVKRLKSAYELNLVGKAYKCNGDFLQAKNVFERSYEVRCSRPVLLDIMDCCIEIRDLDGAEKYFDEYHKVSPEDKVTLYKYRYRIEKRKGREHRLLISILEELKAIEYVEEFAYELAKLYHKAGMAEECMKECNDIILWFGFGPTVERAKALLAYYKGEISLEEIKSAGARYQAELQRQLQEEKRAALEAANATEPEEEPEEYIPEEVPVEEELQEEPAFTETIATVEEEPEEWMEAYETEGNIEEEFFPQDESVEEATQEELQAESAREESIREEEELYVPYADELETSNERLAELLKKRQVPVPEILNNFGRIERIRKQIVKSLELAISDREKAYFVITGEPQTGKTTLALSLIHLLYELDIVKYDRTATIDAVQLNQVDIRDYGEELKNCNLIIENAGGMTKESIEGLLQFSKGCKGKTCVILEDSVRDINKFLRAREELNSLFNNRIHLGKYNADDLLGFAYDCIKKEDYGIDKMAAQILRDKIDEIVRDYGNDQRLLRTLKLAEVVIARAEKRAGQLILTMAAEGKIQQGNFLVIIMDDVTD